MPQFVFYCWVKDHCVKQPGKGLFPLKLLSQSTVGGSQGKNSRQESGAGTEAKAMKESACWLAQPGFLDTPESPA